MRTNKLKSSAIIFCATIFSFCCFDNPAFSQREKRHVQNSFDFPEFWKSDSSCSASFVSVKFQYLYQPSKEFYKLGGTHFYISINRARFFTKKMILGVGLDYKFIPFKGEQRLSSQFVSDFNANYTPDYSDKYDSVRSLTLSGAINNTNGFKGGGSTFRNFSLNFSPFPDRYGGFLLQLKTGYSAFLMYGPLTDSYEESVKILNFSIAPCYSAELSFCPYKLFRTHRLKIVGGTLNDWYKFLIVSLYANQYSMKNATIGGEPLNRFVSQSFIDKYSSLNNFGIKFGIGIW